MRITIDTNVVLDTLARREPFFDQSQPIMQLVAEGRADGAITANTITDIYYILRKHLDNQALKTALSGLMELLEVLDVTKVECFAALDVPMNDYEDAILACCAQSWRAEYIVTRNTKDFVHSPVKALSPEEFLKATLYE